MIRYIMTKKGRQAAMLLSWIEGEMRIRGNAPLNFLKDYTKYIKELIPDKDFKSRIQELLNQGLIEEVKT